MSLALKYRMKKMAKGGDVKGIHKVSSASVTGGESEAGLTVQGMKHAAFPEGRKQPLKHAKQEHKKVLGELKSMPSPKLPMAEGGQVCMHCGGMGYSEGGEVANTDLPEADFQPNEFDVLHLEDDLESSNTGENSGDYDGDDVVKRAMAKRKK
jgi:hypothetical protein